MDLEDDTDPQPPPNSSQPSSSSQSDEPLLLGFIVADIVGLRHYSGTVSGREMVGLVRDPLNPHDPNAIKVLNTRSLQVGHVERSVAAVLSPLIDSDLIIVEAIVPNRRLKTNRFRLPCQLHVFALPLCIPTVRDSIFRRGLQLVSENDPSFTLSESAAVKETKAEKRYRNVDEIFRLVDESLMNKERSLHALEPPKNVIKSELLLHQKEGLGWLSNRENSNNLPPFWEETEGEFVNILTNYSTVNRPEPLRGGILADAMGLGKTLTLLSLIALDKGCGCGSDNAEKKDEKKGSGSRKRRKTESDFYISSDLRLLDGDAYCYDGLETKATLVVCPPSVMSTWIGQLEEHTVPGSLRTYLYYGDKRTKNAHDLKKYDLVLTTYSTLSTEESLLETPVKKLEWRRIILDEAHTIKNFNALQSKAVIGLNAKRRWAVTGTPIQNGSLDLFSLMAFLHFEPFSIRTYWRSLVQRPLNQGLERGLSRLQVLMAAISLRRAKDKTLVDLPPKTIETHYVELSLEERELYDQFNQESKSILMSYISTNNGDRIIHHYSIVLSMILRLRQICTDLALCPKDLKSVFPSKNIRDVSNNPELLQKLVAMLQDGEDFECPICISPSSDIVITRCAHTFCQVCILKTLQCSNSRCPLCRRPLKESDLFSAPAESSKPDSTESSSSSQPKLSSKTSALIKLLVESRDQHPDTKSVVFSQFVKMLELLEEPLKAVGFKTLRLDGSMNATQRAKVIEQFQVSGSDGPTVLLASLKASGAGINLTAASRVYFMEPWWNPAVEEQAMDRVHRIGQNKEVKVVRLITRNSIEEKILMLQQKKTQLSRETFGKRSPDGGVGCEDLRFLMSI